MSNTQDDDNVSDDEHPMLKDDATADDGNPLAGDNDSSQDDIKPGDVDAFWLQRVLNKHYNDADLSQVQPFYMQSEKVTRNRLLANPLSGGVSCVIPPHQS